MTYTIAYYFRPNSRADGGDSKNEGGISNVRLWKMNGLMKAMSGADAYQISLSNFCAVSIRSSIKALITLVMFSVAEIATTAFRITVSEYERL